MIHSEIPRNEELRELVTNVSDSLDMAAATLYNSLGVTTKDSAPPLGEDDVVLQLNYFADELLVTRMLRRLIIRA